MRSRVFVYGTLLRGEVNHHLLLGAEFLGVDRTEPCFTLFHLGAYPGVAAGGVTAIHGEVYRVDRVAMARLDQLEDYPRLYDRRLIPTAFGRAWIYLYRGRLADRQVIAGGDWRAFASASQSCRGAAIHARRDLKNRPGIRRNSDSGPQASVDAEDA